MASRASKAIEVFFLPSSPILAVKAELPTVVDKDDKRDSSASGLIISVGIWDSSDKWLCSRSSSFCGYSSESSSAALPMTFGPSKIIGVKLLLSLDYYYLVVVIFCYCCTCWAASKAAMSSSINFCFYRFRWDFSSFIAYGLRLGIRLVGTIFFFFGYSFVAICCNCSYYDWDTSDLR